MKSNSYHLIALYFVTILSCVNDVSASENIQKKDQPKKATLDQSYFPIDVGYEWIYETQDGDVAFTVTGKQKIWGTDCFIVKVTSGKLAFRLYFSTSASGVRIHRSDGHHISPKFIPIRFSTKANDSWKSQKGFIPPIRDDCINLGRRKVTVPLGTFQSFEVVKYSVLGDWHFLLAKDFGVVEIRRKKTNGRRGPLSGPFTWKVKKFTKPSRAEIDTAKKRTKKKTKVKKSGAFELRMDTGLHEAAKSRTHSRFAYYPPDKWLMEKRMKGVESGEAIFHDELYISDGNHLWFRGKGSYKWMNKRSKIDLKKLEQKVGKKDTQQHMRFQTGFIPVFWPTYQSHLNLDKVFGSQVFLKKQFKKVAEEKINGVSTIKYEWLEGGSVFSEIWFGKDDGFLREQTLYFMLGDSRWEVVNVKKGKEVDENDFKMRNKQDEKVIDETDIVIENILKNRNRAMESRDDG